MTSPTIFKIETHLTDIAEALSAIHGHTVHICALIFETTPDHQMNPAKTELVGTFGNDPLGIIACAEEMINMVQSNIPQS